MYTTQMDAAKKGIITDEMRIVAEKEVCMLRSCESLLHQAKWSYRPIKPQKT